MRDSAAAELLIGIHAVHSALLHASGALRGVIVAQEARNPRVAELAEQARELGVEVLSEPRAMLERHCEGQRHQDIIARLDVLNMRRERDLDALLDAVENSPLVLVLDGVQDPHNLGACLRTADAAGADFVVLTRNRSAGITPVVRRAASGAAETLPLLFATNLARVLRRLKERGLWLVGTTERARQDLYAMDLTGPLALVLGGEGRGMRRLTAELCDFQARIPMRGTVNSLNVSVAAAVCLFEIVRQRGAA